ncbi:tRNA-binding protein [Hyphomonas sp.]|uniref:tRNA-binding protein n=1 Tax=Hyphomonas sp. TaxID=87 RepID=UPI0025BE9942|nr:tRNA-binding protein [Hyphomonas sp.]
MHLVDPPENPPAPEFTFEDFRRPDIRAETVLAAAPLEGARRPSIRPVIDFGPGIGEWNSYAQITAHYQPATQVGRQMTALVRSPPRRIGKFMSEVLTLSFADVAGETVLFSPDQPVPNGAHLA